MTGGEKMIEIHEELCKSCGFCCNVCPKKILIIGKKVNKKGYQCAQLEKPEECISCGLCATMCPDAAISLH